ncbi:MAG TPA: ATP-dependent protease LonB, partial [Firmicutes bacterium]|nr:ATP-dependent protease LonB [Bacillota bacterium]
FRNGLPADFRLIGATTRMPQEIPPAVRSRCIEIFFRALTPEEIRIIVLNAVKKIDFQLEDGGIDVIIKFATNGRDGVNMVQIAAGLALTEGRNIILRKDIEWVVNSGQYAPRPNKKVPGEPQVGYANGLAVYGPNMGVLVELEVAATPVADGKGKVITTGMIDEEEMGEYGRTIRRKSTARGSVENVLTILKKYFGIDCDNYDLHINFPGGIPLDGPSAGITLVTAIYSALTGTPVDNLVAMTGEVSILGHVMPVGGIIPKVKAAKQAGATKVIIPAENWQDIFAEETEIQVVPV